MTKWDRPCYKCLSHYCDLSCKENEKPKREPLTDEQKDILNFLLGASDIDGAWFGEKHPAEAGQFWWRNRLRKAFQEAAHGIKGEA